MSELHFPGAATLPSNTKQLLKQGDQEFLLVNIDGTLAAVQSKCPHAQANLVDGALCLNHEGQGRLVCPWHMATFAVPTGALLEPPATHGLDTYKLRTQGEDLYLDPTPMKAVVPDATKPDARTFLLIGAGAAGMMAASTLREKGFTGRLVIADPDPDEPIDRTQLSKLALSGKKPLEKIKLPILDNLRVERIDAALTALDSKARQAKFSDGTNLQYDAALLATGGKPQRPDLPGAELGHTIRHAAEVEAILASAKEGDTAVILGASFIGLEAASALTDRGLKVTVVAQEKLPFSSKFGEPVAQAIVALHKSKGVQFELEAEAATITRSAVTLKDGKQLPAAVVILGVGVKPDLAFEHDLPAGEKGGIAVSTTLSPAPGLWIAGDIASVDGLRIEHWRLAQQHARFAAEAMLGRDGEFDGLPFFWTFHFGKRLGYLGHADKWDEIVYDGDPAELNFIAYYLQAGKVAAVLTCGRDHATAQLSCILKTQPTLEQARAAIS